MALAIWFSHWLGIEFYYGTKNIATIWLTNGIVWGILLLVPYRHWAPVVAVAFAVQFVLNLEFSLSFALIVTAINCLAPALGSLLIRRLCRDNFEFLNLRHLTLMILVVLVAEAVNSLVGATVVVWHYESAEFWSAFQTWWFSTAIGSLILLPVTVGWGKIAFLWSVTWKPSRLIEAAVLAFSAIIAGHYIFSSTAQEFLLVIEYPYIIIPILMWAALRFPPVFPLTVLLFESILLVYHAEYGRGPFITQGQSTHELVLAIQAFLVVTTATVLFICALIEERRKTVCMLQESEEQVRLLLNSTAEAIYGLDLEGNCTFCNPACIRTLGYISESDFLGKNMHELIHHSHPDGQHYKVGDCAIFQAFRKGKNVHVDTEVFWKMDGTSFPCEYWSHPVLHDGNVVGAVVTFFDISERKLGEEALLESEGKLSNAMELAKLGHWEYDVDSDLFTFNDSFYSMLRTSAVEVGGYTLTSGEYADRFVHPDDRHRVGEETQEAVATDNNLYSRKIEHKALFGDGTIGYMVVHIFIVKDRAGLTIQTHGVNQDITDQKQLEQQLRQTQKLEAIGTLAGGIAHDFNNLLFAILGNAELATSSIPENSPARENLHEVVTASNRAAELVKQILTFARKADRQSKPMEVSLVVREVVKMLRAMLPATIKIDQQINAARSSIKADPIEIHQVVMNLCTNAGQAMMQHGGTLRICLDKVYLGDSDIPQRTTLQAGHYLVLEVSDTGSGISSDIKERIFEPFFTTKDTGQGTGMGLAVVHGIVQDIGGEITVHSEIDQGTTFKIYFPLTVSDKSPGETTNEDLPRGIERIMVVDDEPMLVRVTKVMLETLGYKVEAFTNSEEALMAFLNMPNRYDVIFTDQTMPILTGAELAEKVLTKYPDQPIILSTGYSQTIPQFKAEKIGITAYVSKPITKMELATAVRNALDLSSSKPSIQE